MCYEELRDVAVLKDRALEQEIRSREGAEEWLQATKQAAGKLRERVEKVAAEHIAELRKHKTMFMELASAHRQLEVDLARSALGGHNLGRSWSTLTRQPLRSSSERPIKRGGHRGVWWPGT